MISPAVMEQAPVLHCSDPYISNLFNFRWEAYDRLRFDSNPPHFPNPGVYEGPNDGLINFSAHVSYSAFTHALDLQWLQDPSLAQGSILNFVANQRDNGSFPGHIVPPGWYEGVPLGPYKTFYHANWGRSLRELSYTHPDKYFWITIYPAFVRYVGYMERERDRESSGMFDILNQFETGQEASPRYDAVIEDFPQQPSWDDSFRLKGVDVTVYMYELYSTLAIIAETLLRFEEAVIWYERAEKTKSAVREKMWDPEVEMFFDLNEKFERSGIKVLTCFYPYMTDIVTKEHIPGLKKHLLNPNEFNTPYPFATASQDEPLFSADGEWMGSYDELCPWNGRVWPMTNSHMAEALAQCAIRFEDEELKVAFVDFFRKWMHMMCFDDNAGKPNLFEHYHPFDGSPSTKENGFGGSTNGYLHSWMNDLIIKYVVGLRYNKGSFLALDPFPFGVTFELSGINVPGIYVPVDIVMREVGGVEIQPH